ncbi:S-layer homology domain-containing protein [Paenibacillus favisporus]|uniref:S-layer homology domain-containing protein n=1 Tax=Paenibacillus favisporus TaxID=221028 RepID=UPI002DB7191C|nr:S-layer homology domain-containing protein [Paenibacillus favisporus]MEC0177530.1 S-layer homology domain-containing protein [Paenibacillus favisporus]
MRNTLMKVLSSAALLSAIAVPAVSAETATTQFSDIAGSYAKDAINELVEKGIVNGKGDGKFDPAGKIERQDFAIILAKALGLDVSSTPTSPTFSDVPSDSYAYASVEAAVKAGLIKGQGDGTFGSGSNLSRQDMAVLFVRALGVDSQGKGSILKFSDASSISDYAKDAVGAAVELGLINGGTDGKFDPKGGAAREAVALVASRFFDAKEIIDSQTPPSQPDPAPTTPAEPAKPTTPTPPATSVPSSSGGSSNSGGGSNGNNGGSTPSQPETSAPAVELVSSSPLNIGDPIKLISSKVGKVYLVPYAATPTSKTDLESLPDLLVSSVLNANLVTEMRTSSLTAGEYKVYFVDSEGRMSAPSAKIVLQDNPRIVLANEGESFVLIGKGGAILKGFTDTAPSGANRNINDWVRVKWHGKSLEMIYNSTQHNYKVFEGDNRVGTIEVSSESSPISIEPSEGGLHIQPTEKATEIIKAVLRFTLKSYSREEEPQQELGHVDLPVHFDLAPSVTGVTYQDGELTVKVDQELYQVEGSPINIRISYSPSGQFGINDVFFIQDEEFGVSLSEDHRLFTIKITESALNVLPFSENGKFRLIISGLRDETGNLSEEETYDVNISNVDPNLTSEGE